MEDLNSDCSEEEDDEVVTDDDDCNCPGEHDEIVTNVEDSNCSGEGDEVVTGVDEEDTEKEWKSRVNRKLLTVEYSEDIEYKENRKDERYSENVTNSNRNETNEEVHRILLERQRVESEHPAAHEKKGNVNFKIIENYCIELEETQKDERYFKTVEFFTILAYIDSWSTTLLLEVMTKKILVDGFHLLFSLSLIYFFGL